VNFLLGLAVAINHYLSRVIRLFYVYLCAHSSRLAAGGWSALVLVVVVVVDIGIYIEILQSPGFLRG
jgi:hypothetical protein